MYSEKSLAGQTELEKKPTKQTNKEIEHRRAPTTPQFNLMSSDKNALVRNKDSIFHVTLTFYRN